MNMNSRSNQLRQRINNLGNLPCTKLSQKDGAAWPPDVGLPLDLNTGELN